LYSSKPTPELLIGETMTDFPSYELVQRLMHETGFPIADPNDEMVFPEAKFMKLASRLIQHGADQELEACCREAQTLYSGGSRLRARRRHQPPPHWMPCQMADTTDSLKAGLKEFYAKAYDAGARDFEDLVYRQATCLAESLHSKAQQDAILAFRDGVRSAFESGWIKAQMQSLTKN